MPKANVVHTPSRRKFLGHLAGGAAVVAVAAGASTTAQARPIAPATPGNPDAELIALCARFDAAQREIDVLHVEYDGISLDRPGRERMARATSERRATRKRILDMRATTAAGFTALAQSLALYAPEIVEAPYGGQLLAMLLRDMTASAAGGVA